MAFTTGAGSSTAAILRNTLDEALSSVAIVTTAGMVDALLYGLHLILFCICILLFIRNRRSKQWLIFVSALIMFLLSTADVAITFRLISYVIPRLADPIIVGMSTQLIHAKLSIFAANNFVAELILVYRCCIVWNHSIYVLAGCSLLLLADTLWGFLSVGPELTLLTLIAKRFLSVYIWSILAINVVLTLIIVGRIFWMSRIAKRLVAQKQTSIYHTAIAILVESSLLYSICILLSVLFPLSNQYGVVIKFILLRVVAIMPTLLIVQVGMGAVVKEVNLTRPSTTLQFEVRPSSIVLDTITSSMLHENQYAEAAFPSNLHDEETADSSQTIELTDVSKSKTATFEDRHPRTIDYTNHTATQ